MLWPSEKLTIDADVEAALDYVRQDLVFDDLAASQASLMDARNALSELPDDTVIEGLYAEPYQPAGYEVIVTSLRGLSYAIASLEHQTGHSVPRENIAAELSHEEQHANLMRQVGIRAVRFGIVVHHATPESTQWNVETIGQQPKHPITKLEHAAIIGGTARSSKEDAARIKLMGYRDTQDLGARIQAHNSRRGSRRIPLPLSYK